MKLNDKIILFFWGFILSLIIFLKLSTFVLSIFFTLLILVLTEDIFKKFNFNLQLKKYISLLISLSIFTILGIILYFSIKTMGKDLVELIEISQPLIIKFFQDINFGYNIKSLEDIFNLGINYFKSNLTIITGSLSVFIHVLLGVIFGILIHFDSFKTNKIENSWDYIINKIEEQSLIIFKNFKRIMTIQILIASFNTLMLIVLSLIITPIIYGIQLPYWYIVIPLAFILSFFPVIGNVLINIILVMATVQVSPWFVILGITLFFIAHKIELLIIGNKLKDKVNINFIYILFSMLIGEMLFNSFSGILLGMIILTSISELLKRKKLENF